MGGTNSGRKRDPKKAAGEEEKKRIKAKGKLTLKQSRFASAYMRTRSKKKAALEAGYSPRNPSESGIQALHEIQKKPRKLWPMWDLVSTLSFGKHLVPLLHAEESRFAQFEGEFTDFIDVEALGIRLGALPTALELYGAIGAGAAHEDTRR
jgi:Terminase small subunit